VDDLWSPAGWLSVHQDQLRAQRSVLSTGKPLPFLIYATVDFVARHVTQFWPITFVHFILWCSKCVMWTYTICVHNTPTNDNNNNSIGTLRSCICVLCAFIQWSFCYYCLRLLFVELFCYLSTVELSDGFTSLNFSRFCVLWQYFCTLCYFAYEFLSLCFINVN